MRVFTYNNKIKIIIDFLSNFRFIVFIFLNLQELKKVLKKLNRKIVKKNIIKNTIRIKINCYFIF